MENNVYIHKINKYDEELIETAYQDLLVKNGLLDFVKNGMKVGIKVNLVGNFNPDKAVSISSSSYLFIL